jgi:hypothetical protein
MLRASPAVSTPRSTNLLIKLTTTLPVGVAARLWLVAVASAGAAAEAASFPVGAANGAASSLA